MKKEKGNYYERIKERRFALSLFAIYCVILLLMSGIHTGLIVLMDDLQHPVTKEEMIFERQPEEKIFLPFFTRGI